MQLIQVLVFVGFNLILLPFAARKTGFRWWAWLIWGAVIGGMVVVPAALIGVAGDADADRRWWVILDILFVLVACLRLALTPKQY